MSKIYVTKKVLLGTFAKYAVQQSPYARPDNLELVIDKLAEELRRSFKLAQLEVGEFSDRLSLEAYLSRILRDIPEYTAWNEPKNHSDASFKFTSRYDAPGNPDDDFIDLDALERNVAVEIERDQL